jgi:hypothetical protein
LPLRMLVFRHILHERMLLSQPGYMTIRCEFSENVSLKVCSKGRRPCFRAEIRGTCGMRVHTRICMRIHMGLVGNVGYYNLSLCTKISEIWRARFCCDPCIHIFVLVLYYYLRIPVFLHTETFQIFTLDLS